MTAHTRDDDTFRLSLRGACYLAARSYVKTFGGTPEDAHRMADESYERVKSRDMDVQAAIAKATSST